MHASELAGITAEQLDTLRNGLRIMALHALGDADAAEDVVQETLLRALNAVTQEIVCDRVRLGAFAGGIARHVMADMRRRAARFAELPDSLPADSERDVLDRIITAEQRAQVAAALQHLAPQDQLILRASFFEGLTPTQIAERSNHSPEVIRKRKSRALARLREIFRSNGHDPAAGASSRMSIGSSLPVESA